MHHHPARYAIRVCVPGRVGASGQWRSFFPATQCAHWKLRRRTGRFFRSIVRPNATASEAVLTGAGLFNGTGVPQVIQNLLQVASAGVGELEALRDLAHREGMATGG
jgi:hypothetical protein